MSALVEGQGNLARLGAAAAACRYGPPAWRGGMLLATSVLDALLYAGAISLVMASVFGLAGVDRFVGTLIGLIAFRWSIGCAIEAFRLARFPDIARPIYRRPLAAALIVILVPPSVVFLISIVLLVAALLLIQKDLHYLIHALAWGIPVMAVHLVWNLLLVLIVMYARVRRILQSEVPIFLAFGLLLIVSPVAYQFDDIPRTATQLLTSFNPASHLLAAYRNALWFEQVPSLEVLPISALLAAALAALLAAAIRRRSDAAPGKAAAHAGVVERLMWDGRGWSRVGRADVPAGCLVFRPWRGDLPWIKGRALLQLLLPGQEARARAVAAFARMSSAADGGRLLETAVPIWSQRAMDQLCLSVALAVWPRAVVLEGLLEGATKGEIECFEALVRQQFRGANGGKRRSTPVASGRRWPGRKA